MTHPVTWFSVVNAVREAAAADQGPGWEWYVAMGSVFAVAALIFYLTKKGLKK